MERNFKEIAKINAFVANAAEIREICITEGVDVGVALDMYCTEKKLGKGAEYQEFLALCRETPLDVIMDEL